MVQRMVQSTMVVFKSPAGPWHNGKFKQQLREASVCLTKELERDGLNHPLLAMFLAGICEDGGFALETVQATTVVQFYKEQAAKVASTAQCKSSRWMAWFDSAVSFRKKWHCFAMTLAFVRVQCGMQAIPDGRRSRLLPGGGDPRPSAQESTLEIAMEARVGGVAIVLREWALPRPMSSQTDTKGRQRTVLDHKRNEQKRVEHQLCNMQVLCDASSRAMMRSGLHVLKHLRFVAAEMVGPETVAQGSWEGREGDA